MATTLTKPVRREVIVHDEFGRPGPAILTVTGTGLEIRAKGRQRKLFFSFKKLKPDALPGNMPSKFASNPFGWLIE